MDKFRFNWQLLNKLTEILHITQKEFADKTGFKYAQVYYWVSIHDIPLGKLITICNTFQIPISHFIVSYNEKSIIGNASNYVVKKNFKIISFDFALANTDLTIAKRMTVREICKLAKCSARTYCHVFSKNDIANTMLSTVMRIVGVTGLFLGDYIIDENRPLLLPDSMQRRRANVSEEEKIIQKSCKNYAIVSKRNLTRVRKYRTEIERLCAESEALKEEVARLKKENATLRKRLKLAKSDDSSSY